MIYFCTVHEAEEMVTRCGGYEGYCKAWDGEYTDDDMPTCKFEEREEEETESS